jgi:hypothetical protein
MIKTAFLLITMSFIMLKSCHIDSDPYERMIRFMLADSTLIDELTCSDCDKVTHYSVHDKLYIWDFEATQCSPLLENHSETMVYWMESRSSVNIDLPRYSSAPIADFHVFFNERVGGLQAMFVFYREAGDHRPYYDTEIMYERPFDIIWRFNQGVMYLFEFDSKTDRLQLLCRETLDYE